MSLLQRISSMENLQSLDRELSPDGRKLSFNPVGTWAPPAAQEEPIGAFEVPKVKRITQVFLAAVYCLFAAGVVFGYAAIKPVFIQEGVYRNQCTWEEISKDVRVCYKQELRLNLMFTIAAVSTNVCALPVGTILDRFGPRVCGVIGSGFLAAGALFLSFAADLPFDGYIPGYLFLALGGPFIFISSFQLSNTFPQYSGLILALLTGAFDTSSAIFLFYRLAYQGSNNSFQPKKFFLVYLVVPGLILLVQLFLMPAASYKTVGELVSTAEEEFVDDHESDAAIEDERAINQLREARRAHRESIISEVTELLGSKDGREQAKKEEKKIAASGVWGALHGRSAYEQVKSPWFILITLFTVIQMTRINYFVATIRTQMDYLLGSYDKAVEVNNYFDVALPLGGVIAVPFIGLILDNTSTTFCLGLLVTIATTIGVFGLIPYAWAQYINVTLFVLYRPFYYTAVSDYAAKVFGFNTFGKVYGLIICLAGLLNFSQSALDALTHAAFHKNPTPVNAMLLVIALAVGGLLTVFVWRKSKSVNRENLEDNAEGAREVLVPPQAGGGASAGGVGGETQWRDYGATSFTEPSRRGREESVANGSPKD